MARKRKALKVGMYCVFLNKAHYPSLHGKPCIIKRMSDKDYAYCSVMFLHTRESMAVLPCELMDYNNEWLGLKTHR